MATLCHAASNLFGQLLNERVGGGELGKLRPHVEHVRTFLEVLFLLPCSPSASAPHFQACV